MITQAKLNAISSDNVGLSLQIQGTGILSHPFDATQLLRQLPEQSSPSRSAISYSIHEVKTLWQKHKKRERRELRIRDLAVTEVFAIVGEGTSSNIRLPAK